MYLRFRILFFLEWYAPKEGATTAEMHDIPNLFYLTCCRWAFSSSPSLIYIFEGRGSSQGLWRANYDRVHTGFMKDSNVGKWKDPCAGKKTEYCAPLGSHIGDPTSRKWGMTAPTNIICMSGHPCPPGSMYFSVMLMQIHKKLEIFLYKSTQGPEFGTWCAR